MNDTMAEQMNEQIKQTNNEWTTETNVWTKTNILSHIN